MLDLASEMNRGAAFLPKPPNRSDLVKAVAAVFRASRARQPGRGGALVASPGSEV